MDGQWKVACDRCGCEYLSGQLRKEWTGLRVCSGADTNGCWEPRHPQEAVRGKSDRQAPPWVRPVPEPVFATSRRWDDDLKAWVED